MQRKKKHPAKPGLNLLIIVVLVLLGGCRKDDLDVEDESDDIVRTDLPDWSEETHGSSSDPDYQVVFDHGDVIRFDIVIDPDDWSDMQDDLDASLGSSGGRPGGGMPGPGGGADYTPIFVPCSIFFNDTEWYHVGIRFKGNSSLRSSYKLGIEKLSFKLDFDEFEETYHEITNQRFYGFKLEKPTNLTPFRQSKRTIGSQDRLTPFFLTKTVKNFS